MSEAWAASLRATMSRPLVSRSSRWTMPGSLDAGDAARHEPLAAAEQGVDERAVGVAGRRVDDEARRLVDDQQVVVLVDDVDTGSRAAAMRAPRRRRRHVELAARVPAPTMCSP